MPEEEENKGTPTSVADDKVIATITKSDAAPGQQPIQMSSDQLNERLARGYTSRFSQEFGADPDAVKKQLAELEALKKAEEERRQAEMTEIERLKEQQAKAEADALSAREELEAARFERKVAEECAKLGVKNLSYAMHCISEHAETLGENDMLDTAEFLKEQLGDTSQATALGFQPPPTPPESVDTGATTSPAGAIEKPPPAAPGGQQQTTKSSLEMTEAEFAARKAAIGL